MLEKGENKARIGSIIDENPEVKTFIFEDHYLEAVPGQFVMVRLPDGGKKPFSLIRENAITVRKIPRTEKHKKTFTERMFELKEDDVIYLDGPKGKGFVENPERNTYFLIGGGIGLAPLVFAAQKFTSSESAIITFAGGKEKKDVLFTEQFDVYSKLLMATEDGSKGYHGTVVDLMKESKNYFMDNKDRGTYLMCGPEKMMVAAAKLLKKWKVESKNIQCSTERYMKCGIGVCGSCSCDGWRVCKDGPVFTYDVLEPEENEHFGKKKRAKSGRLVDI